MKKSKKMLILILAITVVVSAIIVAIFCLNNSDNNSNIKLTIDQKDFDTIKSKTSLSGTIETSDTVEEIIYEGYQNGDVYWSGKAVVNKNNWYIKEVFLVSGENEIVITAKTDKGSTTETINIHYDSGTSYTFDESKVRYDEETGITYVNNILLVIFEDDVTEDEILEIIKPYNGEIAGRGGSIWDIKIDEKSYKELKKISSELEEKDEVFAAMINTADKVVPDTDIRESMVAYKYWEDIGDWGYEAMEVSSVYNYENRFSEIEIGVVDTGFDLDHEDLNGIFTPSTENMESENDYKEWNEKQKKEITNSHGTHVAGIIGSIADNKGITGILKKVNIIYSDWLPNETKGKQQWDSASRVLKSLEDSVTKGAKVVNFSLGCSGATEIDNNGFVSVYSSERGSVNFSQTWKDEQAKKACQVMENLLNDNYDFLVVQSSGNGTPVEVARNTIEQIAVDATNNGYWCSVTENNVVASTEKMKHDILNRIIVVGNAKKNSDGTYQQAIDSNGGTRVDICAPGTDIYSTTVDNNYGLLSGTSMAAPQVTGVCGLVWSVNSNFTGAEVKEMVCNYTSITVNDNPDGKHPLNNTYKMVNAKLAVEEAIRRTDIGYGTVTAFVKEKDTDKPLNNITVTVDVNGAKRTTVTDETGKFELTLPVGTYTLTITSDNFVTKTVKTVIEKDVENVNLNTVYMSPKMGNVIGTVKDISTGKAISGVTVKVTDNESENADLIATVTTDKNGQFSLNLPYGIYSLHFTHDDYLLDTDTRYISINVNSENIKLVEAVLLSKNNQNESNSNKSDKTSTTKYKVGDVITFGSYPQSKVTDRNLISALNSQTLNWKSYGYYSGNGEYGSMVKSDYMKYAEVTYKGNKYRAVTFSKYRPTDVQESQERDWSWQYENGYHKNTIYWFKYEPLKWRILDPNNGLAMCESIIDSQPFTDTIYYKENPSDYYLSLYSDSNCKHYANNYETSSIRKWLNNDFYKVAFSDNEKNQIKSTIVSNNCSDTDYKEFSSKSTSDKIFLLSYNEALNSNYGFSSKGSDISRVAWGTDYAKCQGLYVPSDVNFYGDDCGKSYWRLRTAGGIFSNNALGVGLEGHVGGEFYGREWPAEDTSIGIRPAMRIKIS